MKEYSEMSFGSLSHEFAAGNGTPGSGSAAAAGAVLAAALIVTVSKLTVAKANDGTTNQRMRYGPFRTRADVIREVAEGYRARLLEILQLDAVHFSQVVEKRKERDNAAGEEERQKLNDECQVALRAAAVFPLEVAELSSELAGMAVDLMERGFQGASGDSGVAATLAIGAVFGASSVVSLNASVLKIERDWVAKQCHRCLLLRQQMELLQARALLLSQHQLVASS